MLGERLCKQIIIAQVFCRISSSFKVCFFSTSIGYIVVLILCRFLVSSKGSVTMPPLHGDFLHFTFWIKLYFRCGYIKNKCLSEWLLVAFLFPKYMGLYNTWVIFNVVLLYLVTSRFVFQCKQLLIMWAMYQADFKFLPFSDSFYPFQVHFFVD